MSQSLGKEGGGSRRVVDVGLGQPKRTRSPNFCLGWARMRLGSNRLEHVRPSKGLGRKIKALEKESNPLATQ